MKKIKRSLSVILAVLMVISMFPMTVLSSSAASASAFTGEITGTNADPSTSSIEDRFSGTTSDDGKLETDKTVSYASDEYGAFSSYSDDEFSVELSALGQAYSINNTKVTNKTTKIHPDVLFVVDVSGSMGREYMVDDEGNDTTTLRIEGTVDALNAAVAELLENDPDTRWGVICYGTNYYGTSGIYLPIDYYTLPYGNDEYFTYGYQTTSSGTKTVKTALEGELLMSTSVSGATTYMYPLDNYVSTEEDTSKLRLAITNGGVATLYMPGSTTATASSIALTDDGDSYGIEINVGAGTVKYGMLRSGDEFKLYKNVTFETETKNIVTTKTTTTYTTGNGSSTSISTSSGNKTTLFSIGGHTYTAYRDSNNAYIYYDGALVSTIYRGNSKTYTDPTSGKALTFKYTRSGYKNNYTYTLDYNTVTATTTTSTTTTPETHTGCGASATKPVKTGSNSSSTAKRISTSGLLTNRSGNTMGVTSYTVNNDATYTAAGLDAAVDMFSSATDTADRIPVIVLVTDGNPTVADTDVYRTSKNGADGSAESSSTTSLDVNNVGTTGNGNIIGNGNTSQASNRLAGYTIKTALKVKAAVSDKYANSDALYMTIGPGIVSDFSKLFLDPSADNVSNALTLTTETQPDDSKIATAKGLAQWLTNSTNFSTADYEKLTDLSDFSISGNFSVDSFIEAMQLLVAKITDNTRPITTSLTETDYKTGFVGDNDSYVIFTDTLGDGMELTSSPVLRYAEKNYTSTKSRTGTATYNNETVNYTAYYYEYDVTEESTEFSVDLSKMVCYVYTDGSGEQVVRWCIPAEDLPTIYPIYDANGNCTYKTATPIRLIYKVAPDEEKATLLAKEAAATGASEKSFYTNSVSNPATVDFTPTLGNPYYYTLKSSSDGSMSYEVSYNGTDKNKTKNVTNTLTYSEKSSQGSDGRVDYTLGNNGEIKIAAYSVPVTKVWNDGNASIRPSSVTLQLYKNGTAFGDAVTVTADDCTVSTDANGNTNWVYTFTFLGTKSSSDVFTVKEVNPDSRYTVTESGTTVTNTLQSKVTFTKVWDDNNAASRPTSVKLNLTKNGEVFKTVTVSASDNWTYTYTFNGEIGDDVYSAVEADQDDRYVSEVSTVNGSNGLSATVTVTNSLSTLIPVTKIWVDNNCSTRPISVQLELVKNGEPTGNIITVTGSGDTWTGSFKIKGEIGSDVYTVREVNPDNRYTVTVDGMTITNTLQASVTFEKVWNDNDYANRPASVTLQLTKNGEVFDTVTITAADDWKYVYSFIGEIGDYVYSATEVDVNDGYEVTYGTTSEGLNGRIVTVTNSMYTDFTVTKVWRDGNATTRPADVTIRLYKKNATTGYYEKTDYVATFNGEGDTWQYTFRVVGATSEGEYKIVEENSDTRYTVKYNSAGDGVTNTLRSKVVCTKVWMDNGYTGRPETVTFQLYKNNEKFGSTFTVRGSDCEVTTDDKGNSTWKYTYEFMGEILDTDVFTLKEVYTDANYQKTEAGLTVINTMYSKIPVTKIWKDNGYSKRPSSVTLNLYNANNELCGKATVSTSNATVTNSSNGDSEWVYVFTVIGSAEGYYVKESSSDDNYTKTESGLTVTNTLKENEDGQPAITKTADGSQLTETGTAIVTLTAEANNDFTATDTYTTDVMGDAYDLQMKNTVYNGKSVSPFIKVTAYDLCFGNDIINDATVDAANTAYTQFGTTTTQTTYTAKTIYVRQNLSATSGTYLLGSDSYIFYFTGGTEEANDLGYGISVNSASKTFYTNDTGTSTASYSNYIEDDGNLSSKEMVVTTSGSGIIIKAKNTSYYLIHNNASPYVRFTTASNSVWSIYSNSKLYWTYNTNGSSTTRYVTLNSGGGASATTQSSGTTLYFYKPVTVYEKSETTVDTTEYFGISGVTSLTLPTTQASSLESYIKANTAIQHKDTSGNVTSYGWQSDIALDTSAVNTSVPGVYEAKITRNGTQIGTVKVTVVYGGEANTPYTAGGTVDNTIYHTETLTSDTATHYSVTAYNIDVALTGVTKYKASTTAGLTLDTVKTDTTLYYNLGSAATASLAAIEQNATYSAYIAFSGTATTADFTKAGVYTLTVTVGGTNIGSVEITITDAQATDNVLETITFNADGTEAYSTAIDNGTTNILTGGKINGKYVVYDLSTETFTWTKGKLTGKQMELSYMVYMTGSLEGTRELGEYNTNEYAVLYYTDTDGGVRSVYYPVPSLVWCTFPAKTFVADYGLNIKYNVLNDLAQFAADGNAYTIMGVVDGTDYTNLNTENAPTVTAAPGTSVNGSFGSFSVDADGNAIYVINTMNFTKEDVFYVGVHVTKLNGVDVDLYGYEKLTYIPATNIYYEDNFEEGTSNGITYTNGVEAVSTGNSYGTWSTVTDDSVAATAFQDTDIAGDLEANVYGYDSHYANYATFSNASAKKVTVSNVNSNIAKTAGASGGKWPSLSFTFTGTGFDLISLTSKETGYFAITVKDASTNKVVAKKTVDTYYGYKYGRLYIVDDKTSDAYGEVTLTPTNTPLYVTEDTDDVNAIDGSVTAGGHTYSVKPSYNSDAGLTGSVMYYATSVNEGIMAYTSTPTYYGDDGLIYEGTPIDDEVYAVAYAYAYGWLIDENADTSLYQIPVMKIVDLDYGTYTVTVEARYTAANDHALTDDAGNKYYDLYVDSIRIYDPAGTADNDYADVSKVVSEAYSADGESYQKYIEIKDMLIGADTITANSVINEGYMLIDGMKQATKDFLNEYLDKGPNNELYLGQGQSVAFEILATSIPEDVQIGLKRAVGKTTARVKFIYDGTSYYVNDNAEGTGGVNTSTEMYYSILDIIGKDNITWTEMTGKDGSTVYTTGAIVIQNATTEQDSVLSVTNLKWTFDSANEGLWNDGTYTINVSAEAKANTMCMLAMDRADLEIASVEKTVENVNEGGIVELTVTTSSDVQSLVIRDAEGNIIPDDELTIFTDTLENGDVEWTVILAEEEAGTYTFTIQSVYAGYTPAEPVTVTVTVGTPVLTPVEETTSTEETSSTEETTSTEETASTGETTTAAAEETTTAASEETATTETEATTAEETTAEGHETVKKTGIKTFIGNIFASIIKFIKTVLSFIGINL